MDQPGPSLQGCTAAFFARKIRIMVDSEEADSPPTFLIALLSTRKSHGTRRFTGIPLAPFQLHPRSTFLATPAIHACRDFPSQMSLRQP